MAGLVFWVIVIAIIANSLIKQQKQAIERKSGKSRQGTIDQAKKKPDNIYGPGKGLENAGQLIHPRFPAIQAKNSSHKRAIVSGREGEKDVPVQEGLSQSQPYQAADGGTLTFGQPEKSVLMTEIDDLIIKGYQADMPFERDFVSEGVEMLNQFELFQISGS